MPPKLNTRREKLSFFGLYAPEEEEEEAEEKENFYDQLQIILNKTNNMVTSYSQETWTLEAEIHNIVGLLENR